MSYYVDFSQHIPIGLNVTEECDNDNIGIGLNCTEECDNDNIGIGLNCTEECDNDNIGIGLDVDTYNSMFFLRCPIGLDVTNPGYFPSMEGTEIASGVPVTSIPEPTYYEQITKLYAGVKLTCPELGTSYYIPNEDVLGVTLEWKKNAPISFSLQLRNHDRRYTKHSGTYYDLITKGEWSALRETRKYLTISISTIDGYGNQEIKRFPELVIIGVSGDLTLNIQGIDRISNLLYKTKKSWDAFCFRDSLVETNLSFGTVTNNITVTSSSGQNPFSENNTGYLFSIDKTKATTYSSMKSTDGVVIKYQLDDNDNWINVTEFYLGGYIPQAATLSEDGTYLFLFANNLPTKKFIAATLHYEGNSNTYTEQASALIHSGHYISPNLTLQYYNKFKGSRVTINGAEALEGTDFNYDSSIKHYILDSKYIPKTSESSGGSETPASYPIASIFAVNPITSKDLIKLIFEKAAFDTYDNIDVDYTIPCNLMHRNFWIEATLQADGVTPISLIEQILQAIVAVWKIIPDGDRVIFQTQDAVLADEMPTKSDFILPEKLTRDINITDNESNAINTINVIRPSIIEKKYVEVLPANVQGEYNEG
jgi:hypothetical protein